MSNRRKLKVIKNGQLVRDPLRWKGRPANPTTMRLAAERAAEESRPKFMFSHRGGKDVGSGLPEPTATSD